MVERTLAIIKPDAVKKRVVGRIIQRIEDEGFEILGLKMLHLTKEEAQKFYYVHKDKPFYESLTDFMSSGRVVVLLLEKENAIKHWREVMG
ncbi:MAG TPA: nucleoside-diphosphate kinase, partial [Acidobacteria bacterium]|nr:nucleoside-diphosphate kinase [Acidobacteriota bacterium]